MKYTIITNIEDVLKYEGEIEGFVAYAAEAGHQLNPTAPYHDAAHTLPHMKGQPQFVGLLGPMGYEDEMRYEDSKSNAFYSN